MPYSFSITVCVNKSLCQLFYALKLTLFFLFFTVMKGHDFVQISYHMPASCDSCAKPLWAPFRPPPALECRLCRAKFHKEHVIPDKSNLMSGSEGGVAPCKVSYDPTTAKDMLIMAPTPEEQKIWVARLAKKIQKSGFKASMMTGSTSMTSNFGGISSITENNGRVSEAPMRSASQRSAGGPPASLASSQKSATLPTPQPPPTSSSK